jgi:hypothetical protein
MPHAAGSDTRGGLLAESDSRVSSRAFFIVGYSVRWTRSTFTAALNDSVRALSKHDPVRPTDWQIPSPSRTAANSADV